MNDNDVADQYRLVYRCLRFQRNTKWWWAEFLYLWETSIVNAYKLYKSYHEFKNVKPKYSHLKFHEKIAWSLLDPEKEWPANRNETIYVDLEAPGRVKSLLCASGAPGVRRPRFSDAALDAEKGALRCRLDHSKKHWPKKLAEGKNRTTCCQMHRFAARSLNKGEKAPPGARSDVFHCPDCNTALCISCWDKFHTTKCFQVKDYVDILAG